MWLRRVVVKIKIVVVIRFRMEVMRVKIMMIQPFLNMIITGTLLKPLAV